MSVAARVQRRLSFPWVACAAIATVAIAATLAALALLETPTSGSNAPASGVAVKEIPWTIVKGASTGLPVPKSATRLDVAEGRREIASVVKAVYDAMFLDGDLGAIASRYVARPAAKELVGSSFGWPAGAQRMRLTKRQARISLHVEDGARGVATVKVGGKVTTQTGRGRIFHRATLWFEKSQGRWRVIAFDAVQKGSR